MENKVIVLTMVDENGFGIEPVIVSLFDEEGNPVTEFPPNLVPPNQKRLAKPKWNYELKEWFEGDAELALDHAKRMLLERYNAECTALIEEGFYHNGNFFAFSMSKDQANFAQQMTFLLLRPDVQSVDWMTENNGKKTLTRDEFFAVCGSGEIHKRKHMGLYWSLRDYINNLTDIETINSLGTFEEAVQKMKDSQQTQ